jgi:hypothetical protein
VELREPREADWSAILTLANQSVRAVPGAGSQEEWLHNRQRASAPGRHFVAVETDVLVGYAAVEPQLDRVEPGFRLFLVASPERLAGVGPVLYGKLESLLGELHAAEAWFIEYASDLGFLAFLAERGFQEVRRFRTKEEVECVVVSKRLREPRRA